MKKLFAMIMALVLMLTCFAGCQPKDTTPGTTAADTTPDTTAAAEATDMSYVLDNGKLVVGITDYAPMDFKDDNGEWTGFDAEFAQLFAAELGVECEFYVLADWGKKFMELETKNIDCVWNGMTITEEAQTNSSVSNPYVINAQVVVMKADKIADYATAESMLDLTFAVENGSAGQDAAEAIGATKVIAVQDQAAALMEVAAGTSDACVIDITMANAMTGEGTSYADLAKGISLTEEEYGVSFRKDSDLTAKFNEFMAAIKADGTLQQLADKYQLTLAD